MWFLSNYHGIFHRTVTKISQFIWKHKRPQISKEVLRKKNGAGRINLPDFRLHYKTTSHQDSMLLAQKQKYIPMEQDRKPRKSPCTYGYLIFDKGGKNVQWGKDSLFSKWCWENWTATCERMKLEHSLTPYTNINSKWIKPKGKARYYKTLRGKHRQNTVWHKLQQYLLWSTS